jgi:hypothetical protein
MTNFPNLEFPINSADCAEIESIFIDLMRERDEATRGEAVNSGMLFDDPPRQSHDL